MLVLKIKKESEEVQLGRREAIGVIEEGETVEVVGVETLRECVLR